MKVDVVVNFAIGINFKLIEEGYQKEDQLTFVGQIVLGNSRVLAFFVVGTIEGEFL